MVIIYLRGLFDSVSISFVCLYAIYISNQSISHGKLPDWKSARVTPLKLPSQSSKQIIEMFEDKPAFDDLRGFETGDN